MLGGNFVAVVDDLTGDESEEISTVEFTLQPALSRAHVEVAVGRVFFGRRLTHAVVESQRRGL